MADLTSLAVPSCETGFIPIPHDSGNRIFANFGEFRLQKRLELFYALGAALEFYARIDVLGVLAEYHHVHEVGALNGAVHAAEIAHGALANIQVELLPQSDVQRPYSAAYWGCEGALYSHKILPERVESLLRQPAAGLVKGLLSRKNLHPGDSARAPVRLFDRRVEHAHGRPPNVGAYAVALDKGDYGIGGHVQPAVADCDFFALYAHFCGVRSLLKFHPLQHDFPRLSTRQCARRMSPPEGDLRRTFFMLHLRRPIVKWAVHF